MKVIRTTLWFLLLLALVPIACSGIQDEEVNQGFVSEMLTPTSTLSLVPIVIASPTPTLDQPAISTPTSTTTDVAFALPTDDALSTKQTVVEPILVATISPDPFRQSPLPENVWWSEDSQTLFYQNIETQQAWAYDVTTELSISIPYVPRSFRELAPEIKASLPENSSIFSISSRYDYVLYQTPLVKPLPLNPPRFDDSFNPAYTFELWLRKDGQNFNLGLVDDCFGLLGPPIWSANENRAVVNTHGTLDVSRACMHTSWLIDIETLSVGPMPVPWEGDKGYTIQDLSEDGHLLLVRADVNYFYNLETEEQQTILDTDTNRVLLIKSEEKPTCLILDLEFSTWILQDHIWHCTLGEGAPVPLATIPGMISQWNISPDKKLVAFLVKNDFPPGEFYEDVSPGIWLLTLP